MVPVDEVEHQISLDWEGHRFLSLPPRRVCSLSSLSRLLLITRRSNPIPPHRLSCEREREKEKEAKKAFFDINKMSGDNIGGNATTSTSTSSAPTPADNNDVVAEAASNYSLAVSNGPRGHLARIRCVAHFPVAPEVVFAVLTNPDNSGVFRDVADCCSRRILLGEEEGEEEGKKTEGRNPQRKNSLRIVEVEQLGKVRLGGPGPLGREVVFRTKLRVTEDSREAPARMTTRFELLHSDVLSTFDGTWTLEPRIDEEGAEGEGGSDRNIATVATLEQDVTPRGVPRWLKFVPLAGGAIKRACASAVRRMVEDLARVADAVFLEKTSLESVLEECRRRAAAAAEGKKEGKGGGREEEEEKESEGEKEGVVSAG